MKPAELKKEYVRLRAEGKSYSFICGQLHISKSTCVKWERELADTIGDIKRAELEELCESYSMGKEARIKKLGDTLERINAALDDADFSTVDPAKLLDFKLKYTDALKDEYTGTRPARKVDYEDVKSIVSAFSDLWERVRTGDTTAEQARKEGLVLGQLLKAYEAAEVKAKLDELENIVGGRP